METLNDNDKQLTDQQYIFNNLDGKFISPNIFTFSGNFTFFNTLDQRIHPLFRIVQKNTDVAGNETVQNLISVQYNNAVLPGNFEIVSFNQNGVLQQTTNLDATISPGIPFNFVLSVDKYQKVALAAFSDQVQTKQQNIVLSGESLSNSTLERVDYNCFPENYAMALVDRNLL